MEPNCGLQHCVAVLARFLLASSGAAAAVAASGGGRPDPSRGLIALGPSLAKQPALQQRGVTLKAANSTLLHFALGDRPASLFNWAASQTCCSRGNRRRRLDGRLSSSCLARTQSAPIDSGRS